MSVVRFIITVLGDFVQNLKLADYKINKNISNKIAEKLQKVPSDSQNGGNLN